MKTVSGLVVVLNPSFLSLYGLLPDLVACNANPLVGRLSPESCSCLQFFSTLQAPSSIGTATRQLG